MMKLLIPYSYIAIFLLIVIPTGCIKNDYSKKDVITLYNNFTLDIVERFDMGESLPSMNISMLPKVECSEAEFKNFITQEYNKLTIDIPEVTIPENCKDTLIKLSKTMKLAKFQKPTTEFSLKVDDLITVSGEIEDHREFYKFTLETNKYATVMHETVQKLKSGMTWGRVSFAVDSLRDSISYVIEDIERHFPQFHSQDGHYSFFTITRGQANTFSLYDDNFPFTRSFLIELKDIKRLEKIFEKYRDKHGHYIKLVARNWKDEEI